MLDDLGRLTASLADAIGLRVLVELAAFARQAQSGAMLTIRRTRDGFTAQTTGQIVGGKPQPLTHQAIRDLLSLLDRSDGDGGVVRNL